MLNQLSLLRKLMIYTCILAFMSPLSFYAQSSAPGLNIVNETGSTAEKNKLKAKTVQEERDRMKQGKTDSIIIKYKESNQPELPATAQQKKLERDERLRNKLSEKFAAKANKKKQLPNKSMVYKILKEDGSDVDQSALNDIIDSLSQEQDVEYVVPDIVMQSLAVPQDPAYSNQWHYSIIGLENAWDLTTGSQDIVVAVLDTGIVNHSDYNNQLLPGKNFTGSLPDNNYYDQDNFHGSHVAGTIAASSNNNKGVAGVAWNSKIVPIKVLPGNLSHVVEGIYWAAGIGSVPNPNPAKVLNLSLGAGAPCTAYPPLQEAINQLVDLNITVVVAAGNSNDVTKNYMPASCDNVITVAASNNQNKKTYYSNYDEPGDNIIDIAAPGGEQITTYETGVLSTYSSENYAYLQGTSMAAPHVAGVVALMYAADNTLTPEQIRVNLQQQANGNISEFSVGVIDAYKSILEVLKQKCQRNNLNWNADTNTCESANTVTTPPVSACTDDCTAQGKICNESKKQCVECLTSNDCIGLMVCDTSTNACQGCKNDCATLGLICNNSTTNCVACLTDGDCPRRKVCNQQSFECVQAGSTTTTGDGSDSTQKGRGKK